MRGKRWMPLSNYQIDSIAHQRQWYKWRATFSLKSWRAERHAEHLPRLYRYRSFLRQKTEEEPRALRTTAKDRSGHRATMSARKQQGTRDDFITENCPATPNGKTDRSQLDNVFSIGDTRCRRLVGGTSEYIIIGTVSWEKLLLLPPASYDWAKRTFVYSYEDEFSHVLLQLYIAIVESKCTFCVASIQNRKRYLFERLNS